MEDKRYPKISRATRTIKNPDGTTRQRVEYIRYYVKKPPRVFTPEEIAGIKSDIAAGKPQRVVCGKYDITTYRLRKILEAAADPV